MVIDNSYQRSREMLVHLVRTGVTEGLGAPLDFEDFEESDIHGRREDGNGVTVYVQNGRQVCYGARTKTESGFARPIAGRTNTLPAFSTSL